MTEVWGGAIHVEGGEKSIEDLHLWNVGPSTSSHLPPDSRLHMLSNVYVPHIPLYMVVGPSLEVSSENGRTAAWLHENICSDVEDAPKEPRDIDSHPQALSGQMEYGVLLKVHLGNTPSIVTEVLLYGVTQTKYKRQASHGKSTSEDGVLSNSQGKSSPKAVARVHALPLCSNILDLLRIEKTQVSTAKQAVPNGGPQLLSCVEPQKRRRLSNLFDGANEQRQRLKGHGGARIFETVAVTEQSHASIGSQTNAKANFSLGRTAPPAQPIRQRLSRASTVDSLGGRGGSRAALIDPSTQVQKPFNEVENVLTARESSLNPEVGGSFSQQNKVALTKVVMAGMRIYGIQNKKKLTKSSDQPETSEWLGKAAQDTSDEYKLIYHQTLKSAMFALRCHMNVRCISQEIMRDLVDRLLGIFCTDHLEAAQMAAKIGLVQTPLKVDESNPFDVPLSGASFDAGKATWTPPTRRKPDGTRTTT